MSFSCTHLLSESHWPCNLHLPLLCCLCPHHLLSRHLSSSLLCESSFSCVLRNPFHLRPPMPSATLSTLIPNSTCVLACLFVPLSSSALVKPFQTLPFSSMVHLLHPCPQDVAPGQLPPAEVPTRAVPTYPARWRCTAGWQSEPPCWDQPRRGMLRLGTSGPCRGVGMGTPAESRCWCH